MKNAGMKIGMAACCAIMAVPLVGYFIASGSFALSGGAISAALPLVACVALHGAMFLFMGKSCHGDKKPSTITKVAFVPQTLAPAKSRASALGLPKVSNV